MAWQTLLEKNGVINSILSLFGLPGSGGEFNFSFSAIVLGMVYNFLPFMVLPIYNVLIKIDSNVLNAARDLGARQDGNFCKSNFSFKHSGGDQRNHHGVCAGADNFCDL